VGVAAVAAVVAGADLVGAAERLLALVVLQDLQVQMVETELVVAAVAVEILGLVAVFLVRQQLLEEMVMLVVLVLLVLLVMQAVVLVQIQLQLYLAPLQVVMLAPQQLQYPQVPRLALLHRLLHIQ
jgi:hypothetical protein